MAEAYRVPLKNQAARSVLRPFFRGLFYLLADVCITGKENIPKNGAYLIAMNHVSIFDPPFVVAFWPRCPEAIGAAEIWSKPGQASLARLFGGIPVQRGLYNRQSVERMLAALAVGRPLVIAPEGGRSHNPGMKRGLPGVAYLMDQAQVPVVPVGIVGTTDDFFKRSMNAWKSKAQASWNVKRPELQMNIGRPIILPVIQGRGDERRAARQQNIDFIMLQIAELLPQDYQGVYLDGAMGAHIGAIPREKESE